MPRNKKGAGLNEHIENYIEEEEDFSPNQKLLDKHRNRYYKAYSEANGIPLKVKIPSGSVFKKPTFVINPLIIDSFKSRVKKTKLRKKIEEEERSKRQEEIIRRNLEKDKKKKAKQKLLTISGAFEENETKEDKQKASREYMKMWEKNKTLGQSKLRKTSKNPDNLSTNALTPKQRNELVQQSLNIGPGISSHMSAGKRKRKTRKRKRRHTKKKRRRNRKKSRKNKRKSKRRR